MAPYDPAIKRFHVLMARRPGKRVDSKTPGILKPAAKLGAPDRVNISNGGLFAYNMGLLIGVYTPIKHTATYAILSARRKRKTRMSWWQLKRWARELSW